jgi:hypothetical protein
MKFHEKGLYEQKEKQADDEEAQRCIELHTFRYFGQRVGSLNV